MNFEDTDAPRRLLPSSVKSRGVSLFSRSTATFSMPLSNRRKFVSFGFRPKNPTLHRLWNITAALLILICVLPVFAILIPLVLVLNGRPIFYVGERIGKNGKLFKIFKFRTLQTSAEKAIGANVVADDSDLITPIGLILRDTRLDELPQLFNVLRGDMNLIGPRPVRPVICSENEKKIKNYNVRFQVKPGLLGHTQIFVPHGTSKTIRARYNNILANRDTCLVGEAALISFTAFTSLRLIAKHLVKRIKRNAPSAVSQAKNKLKVVLSPTATETNESGSELGETVSVEMINSRNLKIMSRYPLRKGKTSGHVFVRKPKGGTVRVRINAEIENWVSGTANKSEPYFYNATYWTKSDFGRFMIDRHVLSLAFAK